MECEARTSGALHSGTFGLDNSNKEGVFNTSSGMFF